MQGEVDFLAQLMWELQEEARYPEKKVHQVHPLGLFHCPQTGVYDIAMHLELALEEHEMYPDGTSEYPLLEWLPCEVWEKMLLAEDEKIVPMSRALWKTYKQNSPK